MHASASTSTLTPPAPSSSGPMKFDVRASACAGVVLPVVARVYRGQTTHFRTPGGGFAPVLSACAAGCTSRQATADDCRPSVQGL